MPNFHNPSPKAFPSESLSGMDSFVVAQAIPRLIDLELISCDVAPQEKMYAYHWTYLGKRVLTKLGIRNTPNI
jgi:hypothetical protein